jgi:hypothetical protein
LIWPVALSFTETDRDFVMEVSRLIRTARIGAYFYPDRLGIEAGSLLFDKHEQMFHQALHVGIFLRSDFLDRQYSAFEYRIVTDRHDFPSCANFFVMHREAAFLVPSSALESPCQVVPVDLTPQACAAVLIARLQERLCRQDR